MKDRIKELRKNLEMTQQNFADALKVKRNTVGQWEIGRSEPSGATMRLICKEFSVNEAWLQTGEGEIFLPESQDEQIEKFIHEVLVVEDESFKKRLVSMLSKLNESQWEFLAELSEKLVEK